ncbi:serine/threonine protein kinase [Aquifex aeolicus]|uniref:Ser/thr protein kinase n=1 Tax=Aquifex aeolicus (strain VF5) TaxID=224324 RepID=O66844_AQUAE|nr:serine/threonine-protein kinase [Aquifex aeolicus]AAC06804.1 ser/thr protein kinase [Aquifex aeolicus VF5]
MEDFKSGDLILGYYKVLEKLGEGNFGKVYKVEALKGRYKGKVFALKVASNPYSVHYLWKEAQTLILFHHQNIVSLQSYLYKKDKKELYLIYEYMDFGTLKDYVEKKGKLSPEEALKVLRHVVNALEYLHSRGYIHSDLKPENVFGKRVLGGVLWKLGDFSLVRIRGDVSIIDVKGTIGFIAPEIFRGEIHRSSDIYSLGCLTLYMLTGKVPFEGKDFKERKEKNKRGEVEIPEEIPGKLKDLLERMLEVDYKRRFRTARELKEYMVKEGLI